MALWFGALEVALRVLFVATSFPPEARTGRAAEFAALVDRVRGWADEVRVVAGTRGEHPLPDHVVAVPTWQVRAVRALQVWRAAREVGQALRPDVAVLGGLLVPGLPWPTVRMVRDLVDAWGRPLDVGVGARLAVRRAHCVVVPSSAIHKRLFDLGVDRWRVERLPVAVPDDPAPPLPTQGTPVRLVHPGSVRLAKGQHLSIDAVSRLPPEFKAMVELAIAGPSVDRRYAAQLRVSARGQPVVFPEGDAGEAIAMAHAVLCPDAAEPGFPDTALRAMAMGRLVLWADHPASRDVLGGAGVAVSPEPRALRRALLSLLPTADWAAEGARASAHARQRYGWSVLWPRWRALLERYA
ncbi:MAG: glycosyltransferase [Myxococcota bacterium]